MMVQIGLGIVSLAAAFFGYRSYTAQNSVPRFNGEVLACEGKPNCVSTAGPEGFLVAPWQLKGSFEGVKDLFKAESPQILTDQENFLHVVFKSSMFRYPDDVVLKLVGNQIQFRSSSRVGYSDMGVNKKRMLEFEDNLRKLGLIQ